jgi:chromosome segregation ATPase
MSISPVSSQPDYQTFNDWINDINANTRWRNQVSPVIEQMHTFLTDPTTSHGSVLNRHSHAIQNLNPNVQTSQQTQAQLEEELARLTEKLAQSNISILDLETRHNILAKNLADQLTEHINWIQNLSDLLTNHIRDQGRGQMANKTRLSGLEKTDLGLKKPPRALDKRYSAVETKITGLDDRLKQLQDGVDTLSLKVDRCLQFFESFQVCVDTKEKEDSDLIPLEDKVTICKRKITQLPASGKKTYQLGMRRVASSVTSPPEQNTIEGARRVLFDKRVQQSLNMSFDNRKKV